MTANDNKITDALDQHDIVGVFLVSNPRDQDTDVALGVVAVSSTRLLLEEFRAMLQQTLAHVLPTEFLFMTKLRWPFLDKKQESIVTVLQILTTDRKIHIYRSYSKPRIEVSHEDSGALGFVFTDLNCSLSQLRGVIAQQLAGSVVNPMYHFIDGRCCPVQFSQEDSFTVLDVVCALNTPCNARVLIRPVSTLLPVGGAGIDNSIFTTSCKRPRSLMSAENDVEQRKDASHRLSSDIDNTRKEVLISYVRAEAAKHAVDLKQELSQLGFSVYLDVHEIKSGVDWQDSLNYAVSNCEVFIPLVTERYGETLWTNREVKLADVLSKFILPVNFLDHWPPKSLAIQFASTQFIPWEGEKQSVVDVTDDIETPSTASTDDNPIWISESTRIIARRISNRIREQISGSQLQQQPLSLSKRPSLLRSCAISYLPDELKGLSQPRSGTPLLVMCLHPEQNSLGSLISEKLTEAGYEVLCSTELVEFTLSQSDTLPLSGSSSLTDEVGTVCHQRFQERVDEACVVVFILSAAFAQSRTCRQQVYYCEHRKHIVALQCEEFSMPGWMSMLIGTSSILDINDSKFVNLLGSRVKQVLNCGNTLTADCSIATESRLTQQVAALRKRLPTETFVYMAGSASTFYHHNTEAICKAIGRHLAEMDNMHLATGGFYGVGDTTARSYDEHCKMQGKTSSIFHILPTQDEQDCSRKAKQKKDRTFESLSYGNTIFSGECVRERERIVSRTFDICILVEGGPGAAHEAEQFAWNDHRVIPVMCTGGAAGGKFSVPADIFKCPSGVKEKDWQMLNNSDASAEEIGQSVAKIVSVIRNRIKLHSNTIKGFAKRNSAIKKHQSVAKSPYKRKSSLTKNGTLLLTD